MKDEEKTPKHDKHEKDPPVQPLGDINSPGADPPPDPPDEGDDEGGE